MKLIGDVHVRFVEYKELIKEIIDPTIQLGDMGLGLGRDFLFPKLDDKDRFIRGNHDDPEVCRRTDGYLGDFGSLSDGIFFISGAYSIDQHRRVEGSTWWPDEELSYKQWAECADQYEKSKPDVVISHECPFSCNQFLDGHHYSRNTTSQTLDRFLHHIHKPKLWVFAHHHMSRRFKIDSTDFICLNALEVFDI